MQTPAVSCVLVSAQEHWLQDSVLLHYLHPSPEMGVRPIIAEVFLDACFSVSALLYNVPHSAPLPLNRTAHTT